MKVLNIMFQKLLGGIEQASIDYNNALELEGIEVINLFHPKAQIVKQVTSLNKILIRNFSKFDFIAIYRLRRLIAKHNPDCIITHGGRAINLLKKIKKRPVLIAVSHNYNFKSVIGADAIIAITHHMKKKLIEYGVATEKIHVIPNMIEIKSSHNDEKPQFRNPVILGMIGRFTYEKGYDVFLNSLSILKKKGVAFKARIAGDGEDKEKIYQLAKALNVFEDIEFLGWISDKESFYNSIDIFCMASHNEPFGIVLLEALKYSKPSVVTMSQGPIEIITDQKDGLLVPVNDPQKFANAIENLINNSGLSEKIAQNARRRIEDFSMPKIAKLINDTIKIIVKQKKDLSC